MHGLLEYAAHEFELDKPVSKDSDITLRQHYKGLCKQGEKVPELQGPDLPESTEYLLGWFQQLSATREAGWNGPAPLRYSEIKAWSELTGRKLLVWEVDALKNLDRIWINTYYG